MRELGIIHEIGDYVGVLLEAHPSLGAFFRELTLQELARLTRDAQRVGLSGRLVIPPKAFVVEIERVLSADEWRRLLGLVEKWNCLRKLLGQAPLNSPELKVLTVGLVWQTSLIIECEQRRS